jgi:hypothetical protein
MKNNHLVEHFLHNARADQLRLRNELSAYAPNGTLRLWQGQSTDNLQDVTDERVAAIRRELARIDSTIQFVTTLSKLL